MQRKRILLPIFTGLLAMSCVLTGCTSFLPTGGKVSSNTVSASKSVHPANQETLNSSSNTSSTAPIGTGAAGSNAANAPSNAQNNGSNNAATTGSASGSQAGSGTVKSTPTPELVPYNGPFQHIFFHPLIAFPSLAFSKSDPELRGFNDWFVTVSEFDKMLNALYKQNYILININSLYTETTKNGKTYIHKRQLMLPKGKKPLVLSVDDMNYYNYMQRWGTVQRLVLDSNGNVAALSKFPDGHTAITYNNAIVPILDAFVKQHPDFSFDGAKGTINLTGYEGVLGYRTNDTTAPNYTKTKAEALQVIERLKATGWTFASHSWGHLEDAKISYGTFVADTNRWLKEVEPLTGPTQIYVYPFGSRVRTNGRKYDYLIQKGFHVLCGVGPRTYVQWTPQTLMMDRMHIDGISLHSERKTLDILFGNAKIIDPIRPNLY